MITSYGYQLRALHKWEFEFKRETKSYYLKVDNVTICWSVENQTGAYLIDDELYLLYEWNELDEIMSQTEIY